MIPKIYQMSDAKRAHVINIIKYLQSRNSRVLNLRLFCEIICVSDECVSSIHEK